MNSVCHWEFQTTNPDKAIKFYEGLFGWKLDYMKEMNYVMIETPERPGGGISVVDKIESGGTVIYILVEDIEAKLKHAEKLGGKIVTPKCPIPNMGFYGVFADSEGNKMGLFTPAQG
jgi:predicted enzyme related to lactoylglutathione lyase